MGDNYTVGQGAAGPGSSSSGNTFNQIWQQNAEKIDLPILAGELDQLRNSMRGEATSAEHDVVIGAVASAQAAAQEGDGPTALSHLKTAGKWGLDVATKIGVNVASAAIKSATEM